MSSNIDSYAVKHVVERPPSVRRRRRGHRRGPNCVHPYTGMVLGRKLQLAVDVVDVDAAARALIERLGREPLPMVVAGGH